VGIQPDYADAYSNLLYGLSYPADVDEAEIYREHHEWARRFETPVRPDRTPSPAPVGRRRLRVGYVSGDFRRHSVAYFFEPLLMHHDREAFEVFCYSNVRDPDQVTGRIRAQSEHWRPIASLDDDAAAAMIRADGIDILVDLAGHTEHNRLLLFARRPAPLQLSWLGYPNITGLSAIDHRIVDAVTDPPDAALEPLTDSIPREQLHRLHRCFLCYRPFEDAPEPAPPPMVADGAVTFGSFNNLTKVNAEVVRVWSLALDRIPGSRLLLKTGQLADARTREQVLAEFARHGIDGSRLQLIGRIPDLTAHLDCYSRVDIALDTFPYNGTTTTCEALWMGVPVVTLSGSAHRARVSASLLRHAGLPELCAESEPAFLDLVETLASDVDALAALRQGLRRRLAASPVCDAADFTSAMEQAYSTLWQQAAGGRQDTRPESPAAGPSRDAEVRRPGWSPSLGP